MDKFVKKIVTCKNLLDFLFYHNCQDYIDDKHLKPKKHPPRDWLAQVCMTVKPIEFDHFLDRKPNLGERKKH